MKKVLLVLALGTVLASCSKKWSCEIVTTSSLGVLTYDYEFEGTKEEMKEFEASGTIDSDFFGTSQVTTCK